LKTNWDVYGPVGCPSPLPVLICTVEVNKRSISLARLSGLTILWSFSNDCTDLLYINRYSTLFKMVTNSRNVEYVEYGQIVAYIIVIGQLHEKRAP
jgi:hypothetical protein